MNGSNNDDNEFEENGINMKIIIFWDEEDF